jgi:hypothetical protein
MFVCVAGAACSASYPTAPAATTADFHFLYRAPTGPLPVGTSMAFDAFAVDSQRAFTNVTAQTQVSSSDPAVIQIRPGTSAMAVGAGTAELRANYEGRIASLPVTVIPAQRTYPYLVIDLPGILAGTTQSARARLFETPLQSRDVTAETVWGSSNTAIATVDRGLVAGKTVGTTVLTASFGGFSAVASVSVRPRG